MWLLDESHVDVAGCVDTASYAASASCLLLPTLASTHRLVVALPFEQRDQEVLLDVYESWVASLFCDK